MVQLDPQNEKVLVTLSEFIFDTADATFETDVVNRSYETPVVVDFWAPWCGPCRSLGPVLEALAHEYSGAFLLAKVNVDENPGLAVRFGVQGIPAVKAYHNGDVIAQFTGAAPEMTVREFIQRVAPGEADAVISEAASLLATRHWEQAEERLRMVLDSQPYNPAATLGMVRALIAQGKGDAALAFIEDFPASSEIVAAQQLEPLARMLAEVEHGNCDDVDNLDSIAAQYWQSARLLARGQHAAAMDGFLGVLRQDKDFRTGEPRLVILGVFALLGDDDPLTRQYRDELASILF